MSDEVRPGRYRHFKGGEYEVLLIARDTETEEPVVVYRALSGEKGTWVRTLVDFTAHIDRDGYRGPRFVAEEDHGTPTFHAVIMQARQTATGIPVPPEAIEALGAGKRPAVTVTIGSYSYRSTVAVMGGRFLIPLSAEHRAASGLRAGDEVEVRLELDAAPREAVEPADFTAALDSDPGLRRSFERLSSSRRRALVDPIAQAKTEETRRRRLDKALEQLRGADGS